MIEQHKRGLLWPLIFAFAIVLVTMAGCRKKDKQGSSASPQPEPQQQAPPRPDPIAKQNLAEPAPQHSEPMQQQPQSKAPYKPRLSDVVRTARTWGPVYRAWYGRTARDFTLTDITGKKHSLSDYRGKNVMLIFWGYWCGPCIMEIPHLIALRNSVSPDKLAMLAITSDQPSLAKRFAAEARMNYTVLLDPGGLPLPFNAIYSIPSSFFIDPAGRIKLATTGVLSLGEMKAIIEAE